MISRHTSDEENIAVITSAVTVVHGSSGANVIMNIATNVSAVRV